MSPVRILILGILFYIAWRLLRNMNRTGGSEARPGNAREREIRDTLVEDPVCHTLIPKGQAIRLRQKGVTYYFCSEKCCDAFSRESKGEP